jgi:hypothetical protein
MTRRYAIQLFDRHVVVLDGSERRLQLRDDAERVPYDSVQVGLDLALRAVAMDLLVRTEGGQPDLKELARLIRIGEVPLEIHGHARENAVAALEAYAGHDLTSELIRDADRTAIRLVEAVRNEESVYETYRCASDLEPVEHLATLVSEWRSGGLGNSSDHAWLATLEGRVMRSLRARPGPAGSPIKPQPIRVAVLGVTGAGKSSFLNAILGIAPSVLPSSSDISTAAVIELRHAEAKDHERAEIAWRDREWCERTLRVAEETLRAAEKRANKNDNDFAAQDALFTARHTVERLRPGWDAFLRGARHRRLAELRSIVAAQDGYAELIERVTAYVHAPLLRSVTFIDTPGLRDPDEARRRLAIQSIADADSWLYLLKSDEKANVSVHGDLDEIFKQAHSTAGVLVFSKLDGLTVDAGSTLQLSLSSRRASIRSDAIERGFVACTASWQKEIDRTRPAEAYDATQWDDLSSLLDKGATLADSFAPTWKRKAKPLRELISRAETHTRLRQPLLDYFHDLSGVPAAVRHASRRAVRQGVKRRIDGGLYALDSELAHRLAAKRREIENLERQLLLWDDIEAQTLRRDEAERTIGSVRTEVEAIDARLGNLARIQRQHERALDEAFSNTEPFRTNAIEAVRRGARSAKKASHLPWKYLRGRRGADVFDSFDIPLAARADAILQACAASLRAFLPLHGAHGPGASVADEPYSLHGTSARLIEVDEELLEWFEATLVRLETLTRRSLDAAALAMRGVAQERLKALVAETCTLVQAERERAEERCAAEVRLVASLEGRIRELRAGVSGERALFAQRLAHQRLLLGQLESFANRIEAWKLRRPEQDGS